MSHNNVEKKSAGLEAYGPNFARLTPLVEEWDMVPATHHAFGNLKFKPSAQGQSEPVTWQVRFTNNGKMLQVEEKEIRTRDLFKQFAHDFLEDVTKKLKLNPNDISAYSIEGNQYTITDKEGFTSYYKVKSFFNSGTNLSKHTQEAFKALKQQGKATEDSDPNEARRIADALLRGKDPRPAPKPAPASAQAPAPAPNPAPAQVAQPAASSPMRRGSLVSNSDPSLQPEQKFSGDYRSRLERRGSENIAGAAALEELRHVHQAEMAAVRAEQHANRAGHNALQAQIALLQAELAHLRLGNSPRMSSSASSSVAPEPQARSSSPLQPEALRLSSSSFFIDQTGNGAAALQQNQEQIGKPLAQMQRSESRDDNQSSAAARSPEDVQQFQKLSDQSEADQARLAAQLQSVQQECSDLQNRFQDLQERFSASQAAQRNTQEELLGLRGELAVSKQAKNSLENHIEALNSQAAQQAGDHARRLANLQYQLEEASSPILQLKQQIQELETSLTQQKLARTVIEARVSEAEAQLRAAQAELARVQLEMLKLNLGQHDSQALSEEQTANIAGLTQQLQALQASSDVKQNQLAQQIETLKTQNLSLGEHLAIAQATNEETAQRLLGLQAVLLEAQRKEAEILKQLQDLSGVNELAASERQQLEQLRQQLTSLRLGNTSLQEQLAQANLANADAEQNLVTITTELSQTKQQLQSAQAKLAAEKAAHSQEVTALQQQLGKLNSELEGKIEQLSDLQRQLLKQQAAEKALTSQLAGVNTEKESLEQQLATLAGTNEQSSATVAQQKQQILILEDKLRQVNLQQSALTQQLSAANTAQTGVVAELAQVKAELRTAKTSGAEKAAELATLQSRFEQQQEVLAEGNLRAEAMAALTAQLAEKEENVRALTASDAALKEKVLRLEQNRAALDAKITTLQASNQTLTEETAQLKNLLQETNRRMRLREEEADELASEKLYLKERILLLETEIDTAKEEINAIIDKTESEISRWQETLDERNQELAESQLQTAELNRELASLKQDAISAVGRLDITQIEIEATEAALIAERDAAQESLDDVTSQQEETLRELTTLQNETDTLKHTITKQNELLAFRKQELLDLETFSNEASKATDLAEQKAELAREEVEKLKVQFTTAQAALKDQGSVIRQQELNLKYVDDTLVNTDKENTKLYRDNIDLTRKNVELITEKDKILREFFKERAEQSHRLDTVSKLKEEEERAFQIERTALLARHEQAEVKSATRIDELEAKLKSEREKYPADLRLKWLKARDIIQDLQERLKLEASEHVYQLNHVQDQLAQEREEHAAVKRQLGEDATQLMNENDQLLEEKERLLAHNQELIEANRQLAALQGRP